MLILRAESQVASDFSSPGRSCARLEVDNRLDWFLFLGNSLLRYGIKLLLGGFIYLEPSRDDLKERSASQRESRFSELPSKWRMPAIARPLGDKALSCDAKFY
jgi:hypothetical protein